MSNTLSMRRAFTRVIAGILIAGCITVSVPPQRAQAQIPVTDVANLTVNTIQTSISSVLNGLAWTVAKMTIQSLTRSTVNWINSGFQGSPAFVSDLSENLNYLGDAVADDFINRLDQETISATGISIKSPFQDQIVGQLRNRFYRETAGTGAFAFYDLYKDSKDPKAFINGDFGQGGYDAFFSANGNPANNPFGAYQLASDQLFAQIDSKVQQRKAELDWGKGFLSWRGKCAPTSTGGNVSLSKNEKCLFNSIKTPGSIIENSLGITATSPLRQLELADSINEIVAALMGQLINQVLGSGGLSSVSQPSQGGGPSFLDQATDPSQYEALATSLSGGVQNDVTTAIRNVTEYRDNWQSILSAANGAQGACGLRPDISDLIVRATQNVTRGDVALTKLQTLQTDITTASQSTAVDKSTRITTAVSKYQSFLSDPSIPGPSELAEASAQSVKTAGDVVTVNGKKVATSQSLYIQMKDRAASCNKGG